MVACTRARSPAETYVIELPQGWPQVRPNEPWNHVKASAPERYGAVVVGARDTLLPDLKAADFRDAWAALDRDGPEIFARKWTADESQDPRASCETTEVSKVRVDGVPAVQIRYRLTVKESGAVISIRSVHALRGGQWFAFQFAASADKEEAYAPTFEAVERSIRWR